MVLNMHKLASLNHVADAEVRHFADALANIDANLQVRITLQSNQLLQVPSFHLMRLLISGSLSGLEQLPQGSC
jgi:hypothetical protein